MNTKITELNPKDLAMVAGGKVRIIVFPDSEGLVIVSSPKGSPKPPPAGPKGPKGK